MTVPRTPEQLAETVREGLRVPPEGHHKLCSQQQWRGGGECDCFMRSYTPALDAIAELLVRLQAAEDSYARASAEADSAWSTANTIEDIADEVRSRLGAAEARVKELEAALLQIGDYVDENYEGLAPTRLSVRSDQSLAWIRDFARAAVDGMSAYLREFFQERRRLRSEYRRILAVETEARALLDELRMRRDGFPPATLYLPELQYALGQVTTPLLRAVPPEEKQP